MRATFDQTVRFQRVYQRHHHIAVQPEAGGQFALRLPIRAGQGEQHRCCAGVQAKRFQTSFELVGHVRTELGQQKRDALIERRDTGRFLRHTGTLALAVIVIYCDYHY